MTNNKEDNKRFHCQMLRVDGKNLFVEILTNTFNIGKFQLNFCKYDPNQGNKMIEMIKTYVNVTDMLVLANDILSGKIAMGLANVKSDYENVWQTLGGTTAEKLAERKTSRADGKAESRVIKIIRSSKANACRIQAEVGCGEKSSTGLIVPKYGTNPDHRITVIFTFDDLKKMAILARTHYEAYLTKCYMDNSFMIDISKFK